MTEFDPKLDIEVWGDDIMVTLPGTNYWVTYFKRKNCPGLLAKNIVNKDDPRIPMTSADFLAKAWKVANDKARELGWIV
jgi:hypothetical protein